MTAYYNEFDPYAAQWLRNLIAAGHIAPGDVDERSIADVRPDDLIGYTQCHFFAGIGVWSYALRRAGWADDRPVWTGSCPCQPFSAAGKGGGFDDERHLWPHFHWLISQCRPGVVLGEQVASKDGLAWLDLVQADLEGTGYATGAVDLCAAGVGAPHIRQRLWWAGERLADAPSEHGARQVDQPGERSGSGGEGMPAGGRLHAGWMDDDDDPRLEGQRSGHCAALGHGQGKVRPTPEAGQSGGLADGHGHGHGHGCAQGREVRPLCAEHDDEHGGAVVGLADAASIRPSTGADLARDADRAQQLERQGSDLRPGPTNGLWRAADWLFCRDGKWRPVEPGTFPLAHGAAARVGRLRGYGNAINAEAAQAFIEAVDHAIADQHLRLTLSDLTTDNEGIFA